MEKRTAYLLTCDEQSHRSISSRSMLEKMGFSVKPVSCEPHEDKVVSNKMGMQRVYETIANGDEEYCYVFEDDIGTVEEISLPEIIQYEKISEMFFYLGCCVYAARTWDTGVKIDQHSVYSVSGGARCLHAIGLSRKGARELLEFSRSVEMPYMDVIVEEFSRRHPANVVRFDLQSPIIQGHKGVVFQDRERHPSTIV